MICSADDEADALGKSRYRFLGHIIGNASLCAANLR